MADNGTVAVLGTGIMGAAMARNLLGAGMRVRAWNRSPRTVPKSRTPPSGPPPTPISC